MSRVINEISFFNNSRGMNSRAPLSHILFCGISESYLYKSSVQPQELLHSKCNCPLTAATMEIALQRSLWPLFTLARHFLPYTCYLQWIRSRLCGTPRQRFYSGSAVATPLELRPRLRHRDYWLARLRAKTLHPAGRFVPVRFSAAGRWTESPPVPPREYHSLGAGS